MLTTGYYSAHLLNDIFDIEALWLNLKNHFSKNNLITAYFNGQMLKKLDAFQ